MRRLFAALLVLVALSGARGAAAEGGPVIVLDVKGAIGPATTDYLTRGLGEAREAGAAAVVLRMDTPGGLDRSMREIIHLILASPVPVIDYVAPSGARAASAGTYILYASHLAAMAPATNLGAATPIQLGGAPQPLGGGKGDDKGGEGEKKRGPETAEAAKAVNDAVAYIRGLARLRGRNADWAESAVREAASLPAEEALRQGVIELIAPDLPALLAAADGRKVSLEGKEATLVTKGAEIRLRPPSWRTELLAAITDPNVALILMLIGIYGIIFEFMSPGMVLPGVLGAISLLVALFALNTLPINYAGAGLVLLGLAFMAAEAFVPSGVLGIGGAVALVIGIIMMFDFGEAPGFELAPGVAIGAGLASAVFFIVLISAVMRSRRRAVVTGSEQLIGGLAVVISADGGEGRVRIRGEEWQARGAAGALVPGARVRVKARDGLVLLVERADE